MSSFLKGLGGAAKEAASAAVAKVSEGAQVVGSKIAQSETFHQVTHHGMTKEEVKAVHSARMKLHKDFVSEFTASGKIPTYPVQKAVADNNRGFE
jgi:uncharacterized protein (DUF4415 family)